MFKDNIGGSFRTVSGSFAMFVSAAVLLWFAVAVFAECLPNTSQSAICWKPAGADGRVHITVGMNGGSAQQHALIQRALNSWNAQSATTGVVFEATPAGGTPDLTFSYTEDSSSSGSAGCARSEGWSGHIYWSMEMSNRLLFMGEDEYAAVMMHEVGHFLGLAHTSAATIMKPGESCATPAGATNVTAADAQESANCRSSFCASLIPPPPPDDGGGGYEPPCEDHYRFNAIYNNEGDIVAYEMEYAGCF
ncbi:MAG: matrixin family metalloprotease [Acidobacteria bacterium]|nr:matrixin family metalloprotease [Acidobacteriota bacterium]